MTKARKKKDKLEFIDDSSFDLVSDSCEDNENIMKVKVHKPKKSQVNMPWIEKYRPTKIDDLVIDESTRNKIIKFDKDKEIPNIIITILFGFCRNTHIVIFKINK